MKPGGQVSCSVRPDQQVEMVGHQADGRHINMLPSLGSAHQLNK
jgi:hypothetical protein